jgi:hypothetical protein
LLFSEFLNEVQASGQEEQFFERLRTELKPLMMETPKWEYLLPVVGKAMKAINALIDANSIDEFKQTKHYRYVHDFSYEDDFSPTSSIFNGEFDLLPVSGYKKWIADVVFRFVHSDTVEYVND